VIGITGTNGKTTTKELIARVLSKQFVTHATQGNLNNHIGVPLTILSTPASAELLVCEMGANHIGEIASLCGIAQPTHGLITNIGKAHLEGFGSFEGVKKAKSELYWYLEHHGGIVFVNLDDPSLASLADSMSRKITYALLEGRKADHHFSYSPKAGQPGFTISSRTSHTSIASSMFGPYNASNALAAYAVGNYFSIPDDEIADAIQSYIPGNNRSQVLYEHGCTIVKDAYNANPSSMELAIRAFDAQFTGGIMILGDMKELGETSRAAHQKIIELAASSVAKQVILVGPEFRAACSADPDPRFRLFQHVDELKQYWDWSAIKGTALLLKGSRSMRLEELLNA
jgi:UDP-N-acetylmuramoyl-tripeptide--D-alanyl-D-alanine ligase